MEIFEELLKMLRFLRCISIPVHSIHVRLYEKVLEECADITYRLVNMRPDLSTEYDVKMNIQHILDVVTAELFNESEMGMLTALVAYAISNNCQTTMDAAQHMLCHSTEEYLSALNSHKPREVYFSIFHPYDKITRDLTGQVIAIETPYNVYS